MESTRKIATEMTKSTAGIIKELFGHGNLNKAVLAGGRSASTIASPRAQKVWPFIIERLVKIEQDMELKHEKLLSADGKPTKAEISMYTAIRLYAIHQQGREPFASGASYKAESADGLTLFAALANLRRDETTRAALDRRVQALLGTTNVNSVINSITHLVEILKASTPNQKIDYPRLASDLYLFQTGFRQANQVRLAWGQQYYRFIKQTVTAEGEKTND